MEIVYSIQSAGKAALNYHTPRGEVNRFSRLLAALFAPFREVPRGVMKPPFSEGSKRLFSSLDGLVEILPAVGHTHEARFELGRC